MLLALVNWDFEVLSENKKRREAAFKNFKFEAIEGAVDRAQKAGVRGINVKNLDIEINTFPFSDNSFDVILFTEIIEHLKDPRPVLKEIIRIAKQKAAVFISTS